MVDRHYGWKPDLPDYRDLAFSAPPAVLGDLPSKVDLRETGFMPAVYDQGNLGSCTSNAIGSAVEFDLRKEGLADFVPSRLFVYFEERRREGNVGSDSGAMIRTGIKVTVKTGAPPESLWGYDTSKFTQRPPQAAYDAAGKTKASAYSRVARDLGQMKGCLASGVPFVLGFSVYSAFESEEVAKTGVLNMPTRDESLLGGHAVKAVGYDDATQRFLIKNSWGTSFGMGGFFTMPYAYLMDQNLSDDFWTIKSVS